MTFLKPFSLFERIFVEQTIWFLLFYWKLEPICIILLHLSDYQGIDGNYVLTCG